MKARPTVDEAGQDCPDQATGAFFAMTTMNHEGPNGRRFFDDDHFEADQPRADSLAAQEGHHTSTPFPQGPSPMPPAYRDEDRVQFFLGDEVLWVVGCLMTCLDLFG